MSDFEVKGWCPGALRPMMSGDGLVVRIRPRSGCLTAEQARGIADAARRYGSGIIDLSSRANVQVRGVAEARHAALLDALAGLDLIDARQDVEARRNIVVTPFWDAAGSVERISSELERALANSDLALPGKFGFAVDCGDEPVLAETSADVRIERSADGGMVVRADGAALGVPVSETGAVATALDLARWFVETGGINNGRGRMPRHLACGAQPPRPLNGSVAPVAPGTAPRPGLRSDGVLVAVAFGSMHVETLEMLASSARSLRITPWRMVFLPGVDRLPEVGEGVVGRDDPILRVEACPGAPLCPQGLGETRGLARQIARHVPPGSVLHVSGCAKGCACQRATAATLIATAEGFDLVRDGTAQSPPIARGLKRDQLAGAVAKIFGGGDGLHL